MKVLWIASISACLHFMQPLAQVQRCRERASAHWLSILWWVQPQPFHTGLCLICESCSFCFICTVCKILIRRGRGVNTEVNPSSVFALETVLHFDLSMSCWPRITTCIVSYMTPIHTNTYKRVYTVIIISSLTGHSLDWCMCRLRLDSTEEKWSESNTFNTRRCYFILPHCFHQQIKGK